MPERGEGGLAVRALQSYARLNLDTKGRSGGQHGYQARNRGPGMALGIGSPPALLLGLVALLAVLLVGRFLLSLAWKLVVIALVVVGALWLLGLVGLTDVLTATPVA